MLDYPQFTYKGTRTIKVPKRFWEDHEARGLLCSDECPEQEQHADARDVIVYDAGKEYWLNLTAVDATELASDADYYAFHIALGMDVEGRRLNFGLISSARATSKRLEGYARNPGMTKEVS